MALASVILPFYNAEAHLESAIDSILSQDYGDLELILIDDGSTDGSHQIASRYLSTRVCLVKQTNRGISHAINQAVELARGDYVFLHGADDVSLPHRISKSMDIFRSHQVDIVVCRPKIIDKGGSIVDTAAYPCFERRVDMSNSQELLASLFYAENFLCAPAAAITKRCLRDIGRVHEGLLQLQDFEYWIRCAAAQKRFHMDDDCWLHYRSHDSNTSGDQNRNRLEREIGYLYRNLVDVVGYDQYIFLLRYLQSDKSNLAAVEDIPPFAVRPLVFIQHRRPAVRQTGYDMLISILEDNEKCLTFGKHMGLNSTQIFELLR